MRRKRQLPKPSISIVIPCLNERETISRAIKNAKKSIYAFCSPQSDVIVCDNGSTDGSIDIVKSQKKVRLIHASIPGYGSALHHGILSSKNKFIFFADADLSYNFMELSRFLPLITSNYDLILGSRFRGKIQKNAMPFLHRYFGTPLLSRLINLVYHTNTTDCNSGMRLVKKSFYQKINMNNSGMEWASELLIKTALNNGKYAEVPITFKKDQRCRNAHLKRWEDGWRHLKVIILLKPSIFILFALTAIVIGIFSLFFSLFTTIAMFLFAEFLIFSYFVTLQLEVVITDRSNKVISYLNKLPLVFTGAVLTIFGTIFLFLISDQHLFTKYILLVQIVLYDLWLFFMETIKTHLINPLLENTNAA